MLYVQGQTHVRVKFADKQPAEDVVLDHRPSKSYPGGTKECSLCGGRGRIDDLDCWACDKNPDGSPSGRVPWDRVQTWESAEQMVAARVANRLARLAWLEGRE